MNARQLAAIDRRAHALRREELGRLLDQIARRLLKSLKGTHTFADSCEFHSLEGCVPFNRREGVRPLQNSSEFEFAFYYALRRRTVTSTCNPRKSPGAPNHDPVSGAAWEGSRATATRMRLAPPKRELVGSNGTQPAPGR